MAVFRIERNRDYTVMSNHHLRDTELSLKSKGLLSMMLSLPEEWNYTTRGLAAICKEGTDCIGSALRELEQAGYIVRNRIRDSKGKIVDVEYIIYETPHKPKPQSAPPEPERPDTENPDMDTPCPEMTAQLNKDREKKDGSKKDLEITDEIHPIPSYRPSPKDRIGTDGMEVREYHMDFALKKDTTSEQPRYLVFFKSRDADAITAAFQEFTARKLNRKPSLRALLAKAVKEAEMQPKPLEKELVKEKDRGVER